ncbi:hypothetical protein Glove_221g82 [Diversispora epigaea]|uniref:Uncharacterized protein n=1 Tax=Diversispora epigaea TaxID=1348612 RepID=A0A397ILE5_9GLOM|nr:hypothetical protein Glove_221g82 [Diversispora epigaea]
MKYFTGTRIIIIVALIAHVIQAYTVKVFPGFTSICRIYVTDCHGKVIRDAVKKDCKDLFRSTIFKWDEAPDLYCPHIYPITRPKDNKYIPIYKQDACIVLSGDLISGWSMKQHPLEDC